MSIALPATPACPALPSISNGDITYTKDEMNGNYPIGTRALFQCDDGYVLQGSHGSTCQLLGILDSLGIWDKNRPKCTSNDIYQFLVCFNKL